MDTSKAPGMDGFNVFFFKHNWEILGQYVISAVQEFFQSGFLPQAINITLVTLLPKLAHPQTIRDYRPIVCCSILYKIISKTLANRLQHVLDSLVSESQSAFVKGRVIFDNILLAHELIKGYGRK